MNKLKLYIETSVWGFLLADDDPEKKYETEQFFGEIESGKHEIFISGVVKEEIRSASDEKRRMLYRLVEKYDPILLEEDEEARHLADMYVENGVLSKKHFNDLLHLAYASVNGMNALISWNQSHLVKMKTHDLGNATNRKFGYHDIQIRTPKEMIEIEEDS